MRRTRTFWPSLAISTPAARIFTTSASRSSSSRALEDHVAALGDGRRDHVRAGLDAVGDDGVVEGRELAALGCRVMWMTSVPAPSTSAPILLSTRPSSSTSGSRAQLTSVVRPLASAAAIIRFSVPVTVGMSK